jgi:hypothetical protein
MVPPRLINAVMAARRRIKVCPSSCRAARERTRSMFDRAIITVARIR